MERNTRKNIFKSIILLFSLAFLLSSCTAITYDANNNIPLVMNEQNLPIDDNNYGQEALETITEVSPPALFPAPEDAVIPEELHKLHSGGVFMYNLETDAVVFAKNEHERFPPASVAKIMTLLVVLENVENLNQNVEVTYAAFADFESGDPNMEDAADADIEVGQTNLTYLDCLYALILPSACEAANILAYNAGGRDISAFIDMMNAKAEEIGCLNTNFTNASGLYEDNYYSTAYDMFLITKYTLEKYPLFREIYEKPFYDMPPNSANPDGYVIRNTSAGLRVLHDMYFAVGIKIGSIYEYFKNGVRLDGFMTLVSIAEKNGMTFLTVSLDADFYDADGNRTMNHYDDHAVLYNWAYDTFRIE